MKRVLVTGAGGFIGRQTLSPLLLAGYEVHAVSSRPVSPQLLAEYAVPAVSARPVCGSVEEGVHWHHADLLGPGAAAELVDRVRPSQLLHLAWNTQPGVSWTTLENIAWVQASLSLLRAFGEAGGSRAVVAGTCAEYAWQPNTHCVEAVGGGGTPVLPTTLYGAAKHGLHVVARAWARQSGVALAWGRVFHVYGPHEHPARLVSGVARALLRGEEARCTHGRQVRDFLYAPDLGRAFVALLCSEVEGPVNMASGKPVTLAELVGMVASAAGHPELVRLGALPANPDEPESLTADVRRLHEEVGFRDAIALREGVERTVEWWRQTLSDTGAQTRLAASG
jgi:nucleoside-diphosphate-sugar epimerase